MILIRSEGGSIFHFTQNSEVAVRQTPNDEGWTVVHARMDFRHNDIGFVGAALIPETTEENANAVFDIIAETISNHNGKRLTIRVDHIWEKISKKKGRRR